MVTVVIVTRKLRDFILKPHSTPQRKKTTVGGKHKHCYRHLIPKSLCLAGSAREQGDAVHLAFPPWQDPRLAPWSHRAAVTFGNQNGWSAGRPCIHGL